MTEEKKGVTVKIDAELHEEVRLYLNDHGMTMAEFVATAMRDELHPKIFDKEADVKTRTLAFQVPEYIIMFERQNQKQPRQFNEVVK